MIPCPILQRRKPRLRRQEGRARGGRGEHTNLVSVWGVERIHHGGPDDPAVIGKWVIQSPGLPDLPSRSPYSADQSPP